ncbi:MAG: thiamine-phosphate kinase [Nitrospirae bacterium]|nr:thiamine-phosphate kinase [Nitrospirota bacterium]
MKLSELGEIGFLKKIEASLRLSDKSVLIGIGDDAAAVRVSKGKMLLATTDLLTEGIHFDLRYTSFFQLGAKALLVNISDIAAMGGIPKYALIAIAVPDNIKVEELNELYRGINKTASSYNVSIIGGDTSGSKNGLTINITLLGEAKQGNIVRRGGAKIGDKIFVTGTLGDSSAGLELLKKGKRIGFLINRHLRPIPRLKEACFIAQNRLATSMIDISDGLSTDLNHICRMSRVGAVIYEEKIPVSAGLRNICLKKHPLHYALSGGEDYELLFTVNEKNVIKIYSAISKNKISATMVGEITELKKGMLILDSKGQKRPLLPTGFNHFR